MKKNTGIRWFLCLAPTLFGMIMGCQYNLLERWMQKEEAFRNIVLTTRIDIPLINGYLPAITDLLAGDSFPFPGAR
jgi:hypothetical protein